METKQIVCEKCLMAEDVVGFKKMLVGCNFCEYFFRQKKVHCKTMNELNEEISRVRLQNKKEYDAVLGLSGGYDSSSACYWAKKLNLKVLLVHVDNGFNKKVTDKNIRAMVDWSGYDMVYPEMDQDAFNVFYFALICSGVINLEHLTDLVITSTVLRVAKEQKVPLFISGSNINTEALRVKSWGSPNTDKRNLLGIARFFGKHALKSFKSLDLLNDWQIRKILFGRRVIYPLNYVNYDPYFMGDYLAKIVLGYEKYGEKHEESILTDWYQWYWLPKKYGIDKRRVVYSNNVLAGQMTRKQAVAKLAVPIREKPEQMVFLADKFGARNVLIFEDLVESIAPKHYEEYGTDKGLRFLSKYYFGLRRKLRGY